MAGVGTVIMQAMREIEVHVQMEEDRRAWMREWECTKENAWRKKREEEKMI